jgi:hypothetical protein
MDEEVATETQWHRVKTENWDQNFNKESRKAGKGGRT